MTFAFQPGMRYRMPVVYGPAPGPRQTTDGQRYENPMALVESVATSFLTEAKYLEALLPPHCRLDGEPVVTVDVGYMTELNWLAGRGYNTIGVHFPIRYEGEKEQLRGPFLTILWENKADPIITGREELGFAKLFCDIHPPAVCGGLRRHTASWEGHTFMELDVWNLATAQQNSGQPDAGGPAAVDGMLHYRYVPRTGVPGEADFEGMVLSPVGGKVELIEHAVGEGAVRFIKSTWQQIPTLVHIVNLLAELPVLEARGATFTKSRRDVEMTKQRIVQR